MVEASLRLVISIARKYTNGGPTVCRPHPRAAYRRPLLPRMAMLHLTTPSTRDSVAAIGDFRWLIPFSAPHFHNEEAAFAYVEAHLWPEARFARIAATMMTSELVA